MNTCKQLLEILAHGADVCAQLQNELARDPRTKNLAGFSAAGLLAVAIFCFGQPAQQSKLAAPIQIKIVSNGRAVGEMTLPKGTPVTVASQKGDMVLVQHAVGAAWVDTTKVETQTAVAAQEPPVATPTPNPTVEANSAPIPTPTATPEPAKPTESRDKSILEGPLRHGLPFVEVAVDDPNLPESQKHFVTVMGSHLSTIMGSINASRVFAAGGFDLEFRYTNLEPKADYKIFVEIPSGYILEDRDVKRKARLLQVVLDQDVLIKKISVPSNGGSRRIELAIPKKYYQKGELWLSFKRVDDGGTPVVSKVTLLSNWKTEIKPYEFLTEKETPTSVDHFLSGEEWKENKDLAAQFPSPWVLLGNAGVETNYYLAGKTNLGQLPVSYTEVRLKNNRLDRVAIVLAEQALALEDGTLNAFTGNTRRQVESNQRAAWEDKLATIRKTIFARFAHLGPGEKIKLEPLGEIQTQWIDETANLCFRFKATSVLSELIIEPATNAQNKSLLRADWPKSEAERATLLKSRVRTEEDGDMLIDLMPANQLGPYCMVGTLAMVANHFGTQFNTFDCAELASYNFIPKVSRKETKERQDNDSYADLGKIIGRKYISADSLKPSQIESLIRDGCPIIVWRHITFTRMGEHQAYAKTTPLPEKSPVSDKKDWVNEKTKDNGWHASIITGYNSKRKEVILTESWGIDWQNGERMSVEELLYSGGCFFWWE